MSDAPNMTSTRDLHFSSTGNKSAVYSVSCFPRDRVVRDAEGTLLVRGERGERVVAGRARKQLSKDAHDELVILFKQLVALRQDLQRGGDCASVKELFVVLGYKLDRMTQQGIMHTGDNTDIKADYQIMQIWEKVRSMYHTHIAPIVADSFGLLFESVNMWLVEHNVGLWVDHVTACTMGLNFWPRMHLDEDIWFTVLVRLQVGARTVPGGDFAFPAMGWVLQTEPRDVLIYNPDEYHGTTEMDLSEVLAGEGEVLIAFYCKKKAVKGRAATCMADPRKVSKTSTKL
jgi:hypothetical protein